MSLKIDKVQGPEDGLVELFIKQLEDWESDPFLVKKLRERIQQYKNFATGAGFQKRYPGCEGQIVIETNHMPPSEIHQLLAQDGVEIRVTTPAQKAAPAQKATPPKKAAPAQRPAPAQKAAPTQKAPEPESWELEDADDGLPLTTGAAPSAPKMAVVGILLGLSVVAVLFSLMKLLAPAPAPPAPQTINPTQVSANSLPDQSYVTITLKPNNRTFIPIPIQDKLSNRQGMYVLFASKENNKLLIFSPQLQSQLIERIDTSSPDPADPSNTKIKVIWKKDVQIEQTSPMARTYTGTLEKAQRRPDGPLELVLPDQNRDINKTYVPMRVQFPMDTMILLVDQKPKPPSRQTFIFLLIGGGLFTLIFAGLFLSIQQSAKRAF